MDRQRVICHILALLFVVNDCSINLTLFADSIGMVVEKLVPLVHVVGANHSVDRPSGVATATLKIPLVAPPKKSYVPKKKSVRR